MDDEIQSLEAELKRLRPAGPSRDLLARLGRDLAPAARSPAPRWWLWAGALPIAAAIAVAFTLAARREPAVPPPPRVAAMPPAVFQPVAAENVLYAAQDDGPVTLADGTSARRERLSYVDTITWKNPRTNASVRWSVPREEVRVVPVSFQ
ncbi:MAG: hypothetical protein EXS32_07235 [Opitutus sp.]|nr:hypothetical protein [Opitutus sp.]